MANGLPYQRNRTYIPFITPPATQDLNDLQDVAVAQWASGGGLGQLGDGSDGAITINAGTVAGGKLAAGSMPIGSGETNRLKLTDNLYCTSLTVTGAGVRLHTNGYKIFCRGKIKCTAGGKLIDDGSWGLSDGTAGAQGNNGSVLGGAAGGAGGGVGAVGTVGAGSLIGISGAGGAGGAGSVHGGGGAGALTGTVNAANPGLRVFSPHLWGYIVGAGYAAAFLNDLAYITPLAGGAGGGGGGDQGGGGGAGGGVLPIAALEVELDTASDIRSAGGNGGAGFPGVNGGGGGGGGGGTVLIAACLVTVLDGTLLAAATNCPGGLGGVHTGTGIDGTVGSIGGLEVIILRSPKVTATAAAIVPTALPAVYFEPLPDPANFPLNAVIVNATTKSLMITLDNITWQALT